MSSFSSSFSNFLNRITQKPLLVLAICFTLLLTISAAAAESIAPKSLKPSSFLGLSPKKNTQFSASSSSLANQSLDTTNPYFVSAPANKSSSSSSKAASQISTMFNSSENLYFKGKIGDLPIRIILEPSVTLNKSSWTGSYVYEQTSAEDIALSCQIEVNDFACQENTGGFKGTLESQTTIAGNWENSDQSKKLPFSLEQTDQFKLVDFLKKPENQKTYTNEYYPSLAIKYGESWQMDTETSPSNYKELRQRKVILTKNSTKLTFTMTPTFATGCTPGDELKSLAKAGTSHRFQTNKNSYTYQSYPKGVVCGIDFKVKTNLKVSDYPDYQKFKDSGVVESFVSVDLQGENAAEIAQADQIVASSTFFDSK